MALVTRRALILDFSNQSYTGPRPALEYNWPIDVWVDGLLPYLSDSRDASHRGSGGGEEGTDVVERDERMYRSDRDEQHGGLTVGAEAIDEGEGHGEERGLGIEIRDAEDWASGGCVVRVPVIEREEYGKYGEFLACKHWDDDMTDDVVIAHTLFGLPTAYLNQHHAHVINKFGASAFPLLHKYLHVPSASVQSRGVLARKSIRRAACSIGLQVRWHHLRAYNPSWGHAQQRTTARKFVRCAAALCPLLSEKTAIFLATDFAMFRRIMREEVRAHAIQHLAENTVNLARSCSGARGTAYQSFQHSDGDDEGVVAKDSRRSACPTLQSSEGGGGAPWRAVDGSVECVGREDSVSQTSEDIAGGGGTRDPFWRVDLEIERSAPQMCHSLQILQSRVPAVLSKVCVVGAEETAIQSS